MSELQNVMMQYQELFLPGAAGSIDVVHLKWSNCPAGDHNRCRGKEQFPTLAFECVTDNSRRILGIAPVQFGARNDKHIVKFDPTVTMIRKGWYKEVRWKHYNLHGDVLELTGVYLICDGGYLRWPTLVCPFKAESVLTHKG